MDKNDTTGFDMQAAPPDSWRNYDPANPNPGYFEFDWLSGRHPDLYHRFALSTVGLMRELDILFDFTGKEVVDVAAGTGRTSAAAARKAKHVTAIDAYQSVVDFGQAEMDRVGLRNVRYVRGDSARLPLEDASADAVICAWAMLSYAEARRVLRPHGFVAHMASAPGSLCGELTAVLAQDYPDLIQDVAPPEQFDPDCPPVESDLADSELGGPMNIHDFTYVVDYGDYTEAAAILGRLYGPSAKAYMTINRKATLAWRLRIYYGNVA